MKPLGASSAGEYASWYLARDREKDGSDSIRDEKVDAVAVMKARHSGKWLDWFDDAAWSIVSLGEEEFGRLIYLDNAWTKREGLTIKDRPNYRLLSRVAELAREIDYLAHGDPRHRRYYTLLQCGLRLTGDCRVMIRSADEGEMRDNPDGQHYLMDGAGRGLPYMILLLEGKLAYEPVEAFVAAPPANLTT